MIRKFILFIIITFTLVLQSCYKKDQKQLLVDHTLLTIQKGIDMEIAVDRLQELTQYDEFSNDLLVTFNYELNLLKDIAKDAKGLVADNPDQFNKFLEIISILNTVIVENEAEYLTKRDDIITKLETIRILVADYIVLERRLLEIRRNM